MNKGLSDWNSQTEQQEVQLIIRSFKIKNMKIDGVEIVNRTVVNGEEILECKVSDKFISRGGIDLEISGKLEKRIWQYDNKDVVFIAEYLQYPLLNKTVTQNFTFSDI